MAQTKIVVKVTPGKSRGGTIIARSVVRLNKTDKPKGKPIYQTKAQLNVHLLDKNGQRRK